MHWARKRNGAFTVQRGTINVVFLGVFGFPFGTAVIQKMRLVAKSLTNAGVRVTVICTRAYHTEGEVPPIRLHGRFEGTEYIYTSPTPYRHPRLIIRNWNKTVGVLKEICLLLHLSRRGRLDVALAHSSSFATFLRYYLLSRILGFKIISNYAEFLSGFPSRLNWTEKLNDFLRDRVMIRLADGVIPISHFLEQHVRNITPEKPLIRVPVLVDFSRFANQKPANSEFYFLFCSSLSYLEVIEFVLAAFDNLCFPHNKVLLYLVVSGGPEQFRKINRSIALCKNKACIKLFKDLTDTELTTLYVGARALLIPMRATVEDMARFPHKIGEYLATGNPVITTRFGEVARYLTDGVNAVMTNGHSVEEFTDRMRWVIDNPDLARRIGVEGQRVAMAQFEYRNYSENLADFLVALVSDK